LKVRVLIAPILASACLFAGPPSTPPGLPLPEVVLQNFWTASQNQQKAAKSLSMDVIIDAGLPKLKKWGKLYAWRHISELGRITYDKLRFEGDNTVKTQVISRYINAEAEAATSQAPNLAVTPANYKFKYKGQAQFEGRDVHVFEVAPKQKREGLYKGEIYVDAATFLKVRESGYLVKNPSIFLKRIEFVRTYDLKDGIAVPRQVHSIVSTRLVGKAELTIDFQNVSIGDTTAVAAVSAEGQ
jgi:hypothetical protein